MSIFPRGVAPLWVDIIIDIVMIACFTYSTLNAYGKVGPKRADMHVGKYDDPKALDRSLTLLRWLGPIILGYFCISLFYNIGALLWQWPVV